MTDLKDQLSSLLADVDEDDEFEGVDEAPVEVKKAKKVVKIKAPKHGDEKKVTKNKTTDERKRRMRIYNCTRQGHSREWAEKWVDENPMGSRVPKFIASSEPDKKADSDSEPEPEPVPEPIKEKPKTVKEKVKAIEQRGEARDEHKEKPAPTPEPAPEPTPETIPEDLTPPKLVRQNGYYSHPFQDRWLR